MASALPVEDIGSSEIQLTPALAEADLRAITAWVQSKRKSKHTRRAFQSEAQRWLAWLIWAKGANATSTWLDKATSLDAAAYAKFLLDEKKQQFPIPVLGAAGLRHQPFRMQSLAVTSVDRAVDSLRTMYSDLIEMIVDGSLDLRKNPFARFKTSSIADRLSPRHKALNRTERSYIDDALKLIKCHEEEKGKRPVIYHQQRWIWHALLQSAMRRSELAAAVAGDIHQVVDDEGNRNWEISIRGKGDKVASIPLSNEFMHEFSVYRGFHGLPAIPTYSPEGKRDESPVVMPIKGATRQVSDSLIYRAMKDLMKMASVLAMEAQDPAGAEKLKMSAAHSARHTCVTRIVDSTGDITLAKDMARHKSINTTQGYVAPSTSRLRKALENLD